MRSDVPEKLRALVDEIDVHGHANLTRLTVLKKWFEHAGRLPAFGLWVARRAAGRMGKTKGPRGDLLNEARTLLGSTATRDSFLQPVDRNTVQSLHRRARDFQNQFDDQQFGRVRIIHCWPLLLVKQRLAAFLETSRRQMAPLSAAPGNEIAARSTSNDPRRCLLLFLRLSAFHQKRQNACAPAARPLTGVRTELRI